ncbi:MAG TPA: cupin domain-containing protein [Ferruginibacter sp.]|nr:cupin domain-containing protein [Ferruginibacter sp.]
MKVTYPHTIENCIGEKLVFRSIEKKPDGDKLNIENYVKPGSNPLMHTHLVQDESLTVVKGKMAYQLDDEPVQYAKPGETVLFKRGIPHRFWNEGKEVLHCTGWIQPANTAVFFLSSVYAAQNKSGKAQPEQFDNAYLMKRYSGEYDLAGIPKFIRWAIIPLIYYTGRLLGKYRHFRNAPEPINKYVNYYL